MDVDGPAQAAYQGAPPTPTALLVSGLSDLEHKAALAEAWADAFETRWGQERAAAAGVRDAVLRTRNNVEQIAQVRDEMKSVAREEKTLASRCSLVPRRARPRERDATERVVSCGVWCAGGVLSAIVVAVAAATEPEPSSAIAITTSAEPKPTAALAEPAAALAEPTAADVSASPLPPSPTTRHRRRPRRPHTVAEPATPLAQPAAAVAVATAALAHAAAALAHAAAALAQPAALQPATVATVARSMLLPDKREQLRECSR